MNRPGMKSPAHREGGGAGGTARMGMQQPDQRIAQQYAPFARHVIESQRAGRIPNVYCFAGSDAWQQAKRRRHTHGDGSTLVLPPHECSDRLRWPALDALVAIPNDCPGDRFRRLVLALLRAGCRCVVEIRTNQPPTCHYANSAQGVV